MLLDRDVELARLDEALAAAGLGSGATVLVEGTAGIGKSTLLAEVGRRARRQGMTILSGRCGELDQVLPFGLVRQLFGPVLGRGSAKDRSDLLSGSARLALTALDDRDLAGEVPPGSVVFGLYWLCSNISEKTPVLVMVDDAQWADEESLRFLSHLARRISDLPVLLALAARPVWTDAKATPRRALSGVNPHILPLSPLSPDAVTTLVRRTLAPAADEEFCRACADVTGGNPFLLTEAVAVLRGRGVAPLAGEVDKVQALRSDFITRNVLSRIVPMGTMAVETARAVAVLGTLASLGRVAALTGLGADQAAGVIDCLVRESILGPGPRLDFVHPLIRTAIYTDISGPVRAHLHKNAAIVLAVEGLSPDQLAHHLLLAEPAGDAWVVETLHAAVSAAIGRGATSVAVTFMERALLEPPEPSVRTAIILDLSKALIRSNRLDDASKRLQSVLATAAPGSVPADTAAELATLLVIAGRLRDGRRLLRYAQQAAHEQPQIATRVLAAASFGALAAMEPPTEWITRLESALATTGGTDDSGRLVAAALAFLAAAVGDRTADEVAQLATTAVAAPFSTRSYGMLVNLAGAALAFSTNGNDALDLFSRGIDTARQLGDITTFGYLSALRARTATESGQLMDAEADAQAAVDVYRDRPAERPFVAGVLIDVLVARGETDAAQRVLTDLNLESTVPLNWLVSHFFHLARARLRLQQHRLQEALADLTACGDTLTTAGFTNPAFANWRSLTAEAYLLAGDTATAHALVGEEIHLAQRFGDRRSLGVALRTAGIVTGGKAGIALLEQAVTTLEGNRAALHHAHALIELGAALRRTGERTTAKQPLRQGLQLANRCGANPLATRAIDELRAAGARPRRAAMNGPDSLTASELRVARMAAEGMTNNEIAQALFVNRRTIEVHLTNAYRKLRITSRQQLNAALQGVDVAG